MTEDNGQVRPQLIGELFGDISRGDLSRFDKPQAAQTEAPATRIVGPTIKPPPAVRPSTIDYGGMTCRELFDHVDDTVYYVPGMFVADQPCIIGGAPKSLKTLVALDLSISLTTGTPVFGEFKVPVPVRVGMMSGESGVSIIRRNAITICESRGLDLRAVDGLIVAGKLPKFGDARHGVAVSKFIEQHKLKVLIVDPAYLCMPGVDPGNVFAQGELLGSMNTLCADRGCALVIIHHTKHVGVGPRAVPELGDIAWSGFSEWARQWILLGRREKYIPGTGLHKLWLNVGGSAGHQLLRAADINEGTPGNRRWVVELRRAEEVRQREGGEQDEAATTKRNLGKLLEIAAKFPGGETMSILKEECVLKSDPFKAALALALANGKLVTCKIVKNNRAENAFKLAQ